MDIEKDRSTNKLSCIN